jgi:peptidoglycan/LPS O-acetylase OafA/YrhL
MNAVSAFPEPSAAAPLPFAASQTRIPQLDGLRGIAVLIVVLYHYVLSISLPPAGFLSRLQDCFRLGWCGVDLFFVLSGFLIGGILLDSKESPRYFRTFYLRRFHRIFPLYYLWLFLYLALDMAVFQYLPRSIAVAWSGWKPVVVYTLFLQNLVSKQLSGISAPWLGPLWSLAVEEQFYLFMPLAVRFLPKRRLVQALVVTILLSPLLRAMFFKWMPSHPTQYVATPMRADGLAMGVLLAVALRDKQWHARLSQNLNGLYAAIAMLFVGVLYLALRTPAPGGFAEAVWGISCLDAFFSLVMLLALLRPYGSCADFCRRPTLRNIGGISYCVYVIHLAVNALSQALLRSRFQASPLVLDTAGVLVACIFTWALAKLSWHYLESPLIRRGHAYKY